MDRCEHWLERNHDLNNGLMSLAYTLKSGNYIHTPPFIYATIEKGNDIQGCAILAQPDGMLLSDMSECTVDHLFEALLPLTKLPGRIFGPVDPTRQLAEHWAAFTSQSYNVESNWYVYRLDRLAPLQREVDGILRHGTSEDEKLVRRLGRMYGKEKPAAVDIQGFMLKKLADKHLYVWDDQGAKSVLTLSGTQCTGTRISAVYTPPENRGLGYASASVAKISQQLLAKGAAFVTLNAEIGDPAARIYERLGYYPIGSRSSIVFETNSHNDET